MNGERVAVVLGARNLGGAILDHLSAQGWRTAGVARSEETAARVSERGSLAVATDASEPGVRFRRRSTRCAPTSGRPRCW